MCLLKIICFTGLRGSSNGFMLMGPLFGFLGAVVFEVNWIYFFYNYSDFRFKFQDFKIEAKKCSASLRLELDLWLHRFQAGSILIPRFGISYFCERRILFWFLSISFITKEFCSHSTDDFKDTISQIQETGRGNANSFFTIQSVIEITLMIVLKMIK